MSPTQSAVLISTPLGRYLPSTAVVLPQHLSRMQPSPDHSTKALDHQIFSKGEWRRAQMTAHPKVSLQIALDRPASRAVDVEGIADTGAPSDIWSLDQFLTAGFLMSDLSPAALSLNAANKSPIRIDGVFQANITGIPSGTRQAPSCRSMMYVSRDVKTLYLSYDSMLQLGIINQDFPTVGKFSSDPNMPDPPDPARHITSPSEPPVGSICGATTDDGGICTCPRRTAPPARPKKLPFPCTPENNGKMREWLLEQYGSSTFNT